MESLNFQQGEIIGKQELIQWNINLREASNAIFDKLGYGPVDNVGILMKDADTLDGDFALTEGQDIAVAAGWAVGDLSKAYIDPVISTVIGTSINGIPITLPHLDNFIPFYTAAAEVLLGTSTIGQSRYIYTRPRITVFEEGTCSIVNLSNQVILPTAVVLKLRDQTSNSPSKLTFFTDASTKYNSGAIYEVISIVNSTTVTVTGVTPTLTTGYVAIVGSYDLLESATLSTSNYYLYGYVRGMLGAEVAVGDVDGAVILGKGTVGISNVTITDLRKNYLFSLDSRRNSPWESVIGLFGNNDPQSFDIDNSTMYIRGVNLDINGVPERLEVYGSITFNPTAAIKDIQYSEDVFQIYPHGDYRSEIFNMISAIDVTSIKAGTWSGYMSGFIGSTFSTPHYIPFFCYSIAADDNFTIGNPYKFHTFLNKI